MMILADGSFIAVPPRGSDAEGADRTSGRNSVFGSALQAAEAIVLTTSLVDNDAGDDMLDRASSTGPRKDAEEECAEGVV
jgi:hypothetical protein